MDGIHLKGSIFAVRTDDEGESKITFRVPSSCLKEALGCSVITRMELDIFIQPADKKKPDFAGEK